MTEAEITNAIVELEMAEESLMGIAGAIQRNELDGRQDQCYRTRDRLIALQEALKSHRATLNQKDKDNA